MIATATRLAGAVAALLAVSAPAVGGPGQNEINQAIEKGAASLKARYANGGGAAAGGNLADHGLGGTCLAGLAMLEAGVKPGDPAVKAVTAQVRGAAYKQHRTYSVALCLMYLDRLGDPADVPLIQMLACRLLVGQTSGGGWDYDCTAEPRADEEAWLRANLKPLPGDEGKKWHPDAAKYHQALLQARAAGTGGPTGATTGDNSNTQFAVIAVWMSRKYGAPVDPALDLVEKRFLASQDLRTGNWPYSPVTGFNQSGSPAMYCAGLITLATGLARRDERRKVEPKPVPKSDKPLDPFYNPPPPRDKEPKENKPVRANDPRDLVIQRAFTGLGLTLVEQMRSGKGLLFADGTGGHGTGDLYFLWSLERVGVVYGVDKVGGLDWYDLGAAAVIRAQGADGSWGTGGYGPEVNTSFAVLFLCRSNLARDLSSKVQKDPASAEMRAGPGPGRAGFDPVGRSGGVAPVVATPILDLPNPTGDAGVALASRMLRAQGSEWMKMLTAARDEKGPTNTKALVMAATHADGPRKSAARDALAERLWRMTPSTLRGMMKAEEPELRRAAAVACAMRDDKEHVPDLIALLTDPNDSVTRAAKASLKGLTGKDFGPPAVPTADQKTAAAAEWRAWYAKEGKK